MTCYSQPSVKRPTTQPKQLNKQGLPISKLGHPNLPSVPVDTHGRHRARNTACIIRMDSSCGYACFWGLFGCLAAFWRVFEVAAKVSNLDTSNGLLALG